MIPTPLLDALEHNSGSSGTPQKEASPLARFYWEKLRSGEGPLLQKPLSFLDTYHASFHPIRLQQRSAGAPVRLLEIGVQSGGSIDMWRDYFGSEM